MTNKQYLNQIDRESYEEQEKHDCYCDREVCAITVEKGTVLPHRQSEIPGNSYGGVINAEGEYVKESAQRIVGTEMCQGYIPEKVEKSDKTAVWLGGFHNHWGHFLTEMVSRCWYMVEHQEEMKNFSVAYVRRTDIGSSRICGNYLEFLKLLGIREAQLIEVSVPTQFKEVIVPELSCRAGEFYTKEYAEIFDFVRDHVSITEKVYEKVYFTRLKSKSFARTELGEKKICKLFRKNGYHVVAPEHCTLQQQIHYIKNSKELVTISGTLPHNILFAFPNVHVTVINRTGGANYYQTMINQVRNAEITYVDAHLSLLPVFAGGPFLMYLSDNLLNYARERKFQIGRLRENPISMHIKLAWYFFYYMDVMTKEGIERWELDKKYGVYMMNHYAFYRERIPDYDKKTIQRLRKCFYVLARMVH